MLHFAFDRRQSNDYGEFSYVDQGEAEIALSEARSFVEAIDSFLKESLSNSDESSE